MHCNFVGADYSACNQSVACCGLPLQVLLDAAGIDADEEEDEGDSSNTCLRLGARAPLRAIVDAVQVRIFSTAQHASIARKRAVPE